MRELDGKVAIVTGAGSGMGQVSTRIFVREGARARAADISGHEEDAAAELGDRVVPLHCDISREEDVAAMVDAAVSELGRLDVLCEYGDIGTRADCLHPGSVRATEGASVAAAEMYPGLVDKPAMKRAGRPEEVGELACFLASDRASFTSGTIIPVDGPLSCRLP